MTSPAVSTTFPQPVRLEMDSAIKKAVSEVVTGQGKAGVTVTTRGVEATVAYQPKSWLQTGGYAARLWGGGWEAGARATVMWGRR